MKRNFIIILSSVLIFGLFQSQIDWVTTTNPKKTEQREIRNALKTVARESRADKRETRDMLRSSANSETAEAHNRNIQKLKNRWDRTWFRLMKVI